jgi:trehalose 6-phosphate synthase
MNYPQEKKILEFLEGKNLILASNRGPVEFQKEENKIVMKRGAGGLVATLMPLMEALNGVWIASAMTAEDETISRKYPENRVPVPQDDPKFWVSFVLSDPEQYRKYYSVISNPLLWFVQHNMWNSPYTPDIDDEIHDAWKDGYELINQLFSDKIVREANRNSKKPLIMLQDYHLYLCPVLIRKELKNIFLSQFIHIPWPQCDYFNIIPEYMRTSIMEGLLSNNLLGFHIPRYVTNFLQCADSIAEEVDYAQGTVQYNGNITQVRSYPISVDYNSITDLSCAGPVCQKEHLINDIKKDMFLFYRSDRADLSKNIIRGFKAYSLFLDKHPEYKGKVKFLSTGKPTRQQIKEYDDYSLKIIEVVKKINNKHGYDGWEPIESRSISDYGLCIACFKNYDCLVVNPIADGMNIVPKEASVVNEQNGVLVLSVNAGCYDELKDYSLNVNPFDITETADAFYQAVKMGEEERKKRQEGLKEIIKKRTIYHWISEQFDDIEWICNNTD